MKPADLTRLLLLAALWGGSFLFMRIGAPVLGPLLLMGSRVALAALFLAGVAWWWKAPLNARRHWRHYAVLGLFNSALPFLLFGIAAQTLSASLLSILNATTPIWGAVIGALWTRTRISGRRLVGLLLGVAGVAVLVGFDRVVLQPGAGWAVVMGLLAAVSYGIAGTYAKSAPAVEPLANAHGSLWAATLLITPAMPWFPAPVAPSAGVLAAVLALGVVCSGVAYLLYFRLIADLGPTSALTVTFLIPVFGVLWGALFLGETVGWHTALGSAVVIAGTALVTGVAWPPRAAPAAHAPDG